RFRFPTREARSTSSASIFPNTQTRSAMAKTTAAPPEENKVIAARNKNLEMVLQTIAKEYGDGAIMRLGESKQMDVEVIPTGNILIDRALGCGGLPRGRMVEVFG